MRRSARLATIVFAAVTVAACGGGAASPAASSPPSTAPASSAASVAPSTGGGGVEARIVNFAFDPPSITAKVGDTVTWTNEDGAPHTVTLDDGSVGSQNLAKGAKFEHTFGAAGTFAYHCAIHPSMKGTVEVGG